MKIVTWNLERGYYRRRRVVEPQNAFLGACRADILLLTEVPAPMSAPRAGIALSPVQRRGPRGMEAWVSIAAEPCLPLRPDLPFDRMAAVARTMVEGELFLVYGSVLPWLSAVRQAPYLTRGDESPLALFACVLHGQVNDRATLRGKWPGHTLIWAGDFNQSLSGPNYGGSARQRQLLAEALVELDLGAWNHEQPHAKPTMHTQCTQSISSADLQIAGLGEWNASNQNAMAPFSRTMRPT